MRKIFRFIRHNNMTPGPYWREQIDFLPGRHTTLPAPWTLQTRHLQYVINGCESTVAVIRINTMWNPLLVFSSWPLSSHPSFKETKRRVIDAIGRSCGWWVQLLRGTYCTCACVYRLLCFGGGRRQSLLTVKHNYSRLLSEPYGPAVPSMSVNTPAPARHLKEV